MPIRLKKKASERDVVELLEDLLNTEFKRGQRGVVITAFLEPREAYDLEIVDESGQAIGFAYSVRPDQFSNLSLDAFIRAMEAVERGELSTAETELRIAVDLRPDSIGYFVNSIVASFGEEKFKKGQNEISFMIPLLRLALRVRPDYEVARKNLAIAFLKFGVSKGNSGNIADAFELFYSALSIKTDEHTENAIRNDLALALTSFGEELFKKGDFDNGLNSFRSALLAAQNETTRRNVGLAYGIHATFLMESKEFDLAIQEFDRAEDTGVIIPDFITCYGVCLAMKGDVKLAEQAFKRALEIDPSNQEAHHNLDFLKKVVAQRDLNKLLFPTVPSEAISFGHGTFQSPVWQHDDRAHHEMLVLT